MVSAVNDFTKIPESFSNKFKSISESNERLTESKDIVDEYISSNTQPNVSLLTEPDSIEQYKTFRNSQVNSQNSDSKDQVSNIDYESEFQDYMKSRGCNNEQELKILNSSWMSYHTKDEFVNDAATRISNTMNSLSSNGLSSKDSDGVNYKSSINNINLQDISNYVNADNSASSFKEKVSALQSFSNTVAKQDDVDSSTKGIFSELSQNISNSSVAIAKFSDKLEEQNKIFEEADVQNSKYKASLIASYQV